MSIRPATKGWAVLEEFAKAYPEGTTRSAVSETVGCTAQRVGEVVRGNNGLVTVVEGGGYAITPEAWKLFTLGEVDAAKTVTTVQENVVSLRSASTKQAAANSNLAAALETKGVPEVSTEPADVYKRVMAYPDSATDEEFEVAAAFAKAKKRKRPQLPQRP